MRTAAPSIRPPITRFAVPALSRSAVLTWLAPLAAAAAIAGRRWSQTDGYVPGNDPGTWLAFGRDLFGGPGRSSPAAYPPLVPALTHLARLATDPMRALHLVGIGSLVVVTLAAFFVARRGMAPLFALGTAALVGLSGILTETFAFGGYPQNYALAFALLAAFALASFLKDGRRRALIGTTAALLGAALSHHMYFAVACAVAAVVWLLWLTTRPARPVAIRRTVLAVAAGAVALLGFLPTVLALRDAGYDAPVNPDGLALDAALRYALREAPWLWVAVVVASAVYLVLTPERRRDPTWQVTAALLAASLPLLIATGETRLVPPLLVGASLGLGLLLNDLWKLGRTAVWAGLAPTLAVALPLLLWFQTDDVAAGAYDFYREADRSLLAAAALVEAHPGHGLAVVRKSADGWPAGWWFEGLTEKRIAVGSEEKWLAFPEERANARLAALLFDGTRPSAEIAHLAADRGVALLVVRKHEWIGWQRWLAEPTPALTVAYEDPAADGFLVLAVDPRSPG